ncbi:MAG: pantetheine-phosphate adenylyltransferase [Bacteroidaceae bacterium]|jgi:pantetheine-phosphate adenylyltransferase|nr:pantetheine-phosphate adenylyltransferase [Bacteroidaceae bacterium]MBR3618178.1 pantetheine-phosphate adenylyltransferase [Bacteroidaceae bacterium]
MNKIAIFPGSFDPFTIGHKNIVDRALESVADEVIVAIGINYEKKYMFSLEERLQAIREVYKDEPRVRVESYEGLTTDFAKRVGGHFLLKGVRSVKDYEYERDMAEVNRRLTGIETVLLFTDAQYSSVSSSIVRELISYHQDVKDYLP